MVLEPNSTASLVRYSALGSKLHLDVGELLLERRHARGEGVLAPVASQVARSDTGSFVCCCCPPAWGRGPQAPALTIPAPPAAKASALSTVRRVVCVACVAARPIAHQIVLLSLRAS